MSTVLSPPAPVTGRVAAPDPFRRADSRWFDGRQWTSSVMRGGVRGLDQPG